MKIVFMGTPDFAVPTLEKIYNSKFEVSLVITQPDRRKGRGKNFQAPPIKETAEKLDLPVEQPQKVKDILEILREIAPDVIVVAAYGQLIPKEILSLPKYGCLNVHASLLPKYRGAAPIHWAVINGDEETGVTIMQMDQGLDTGDMLAQNKVKININDTMGDIHDKLSMQGADLIVEVLKKLPNDIEKISQNDSLAVHAPKIQRDMEKIHWERPTLDIHNLIRGLNPWPGAYTTFGEESLKIWMSEIVNLEGTNANPGTIINVDPNYGIDIQTGRGVIRLIELQQPGKKRMATREFLKGKALSIGERISN